MRRWLGDLAFMVLDAVDAIGSFIWERIKLALIFLFLLCTGVMLGMYIGSVIVGVRAVLNVFGG